MNTKTVVFFSLLLATHCASAVKQRRVNLTKKLITEIKQNTVRQNIPYTRVIAHHVQIINKILAEQQ
jgi:hypothetical protein